MRDGRRYELGIAQRRERHPEGAVGERRPGLGGDLERQSRLARPAGARQRQEARAVEQAEPVPDLLLAPDECRELHREVVRDEVQRSERREVRRAILDDELEDPLRLREILEPMLSQVSHRHILGHAVAGEDLGRFGNQHLAAMRSGANPSGTMHIKSRVVTVCAPRFSGM